MKNENEILFRINLEILIQNFSICKTKTMSCLGNRKFQHKHLNVQRNLIIKNLSFELVYNSIAGSTKEVKLKPNYT